MTKTCGECKYHIYECHCGKFECYAGKSDFCDEFEPKEKKVITNGDKIRQGGNDALIDFADGCRRMMCHYCVYSKYKTCVDKAGNCWEGVRAWLNAPAESEGEE